jgi:hypothetical protein
MSSNKAKIHTIEVHHGTNDIEMVNGKPIE